MTSFMMGFSAALIGITGAFAHHGDPNPILLIFTVVSCVAAFLLFCFTDDDELTWSQMYLELVFPAPSSAWASWLQATSEPYLSASWESALWRCPLGSNTWTETKMKSIIKFFKKRICKRKGHQWVDVNWAEDINAFWVAPDTHWTCLRCGERIPKTQRHLRYFKDETDAHKRKHR